MTRIQYALVALALAAAACSPPASETTPPASETAPATAGASAVPPEIAAAATAAAPGMTITGGEMDAPNNEYEVMGTMADGSEIELDMVQSNGAWTVLEIQRDVPWSSVPEQVRAAATAARAGFEPARVIESKQAADGSVVYELFPAETPQGGTTPGGPMMEVRWHEGKAAVLPREAPPQ